MDRLVNSLYVSKRDIWETIFNIKNDQNVIKIKKYIYIQEKQFFKKR